MIGRTIRLITESIAARNKRKFLRKFDITWFQNKDLKVQLRVASFSGEKQFADQLYSITSFYRNVGTPLEWIIFSDGSHSDLSRKILSSIPGVIFKKLDNHYLPTAYRNINNPLLKKVFYYKTIPIETTTMFVDSDVIFYQPFRNFLASLSNKNWFLIDEKWGFLDTLYLEKVKETPNPCNSGLLIFNQEPAWEIVLNYLEKQNLSTDGLQHWSEQTAFHILTRDSSVYHALNKDYFVVNGEDSFHYGACVNYNQIALRHFVGPVRHKMWQYSWRKILQIKN